MTTSMTTINQEHAVYVYLNSIHHEIVTNRTINELLLFEILHASFELMLHPRAQHLYSIISPSKRNDCVSKKRFIIDSYEL